jgi:hypothetical protein
VNWASYHRCVRVSVATGGTLPALSTGSVVVDRLLNGTTANPVFTITTALSPTYIEAQAQVPARGELNNGLAHAITLDGATNLPNYLVGN